MTSSYGAPPSVASSHVATLALSACGGADDPVDTDAPTTVATQPATDEPAQAEPTDAATTEAPVEEAPEATPEGMPEATEDAPDGSAGGAEDELVRNMAEGMKGVETIKTTTEGSTGTSVVYTDLRDPDKMRQVYESVELVDAGERQYKVSLAGFGSEPIEMMMWLDEHHRPIKQEFTIGDIAQSATMEYNVPVEIPTVG